MGYHVVGWSAVTSQVIFTYTASLIVGLTAQHAGRPDLTRSPKRVLAHLWEEDSELWNVLIFGIQLPRFAGISPYWLLVPDCSEEVSFLVPLYLSLSFNVLVHSEYVW